MDRAKREGLAIMRGIIAALVVWAVALVLIAGLCLVVAWRPSLDGMCVVGIALLTAYLAATDATSRASDTERNAR